MTKKWKQLCGKIGKDRFLILIIGGLLILVITYPLPTQSGSSKTTGNVNGSDADQNVGMESVGVSSGGGTNNDYQSQLEERLSDILSGIYGAGDVKVFITFSDYGSSIVEKDTSYTRNNEEQSTKEESESSVLSTENTEETVYTTDADGNDVPFVYKMTSPQVDGVLVVAQGGGNQEVEQEMKEAIMALFGIEEHRIKVVRMKGEEG